MTTAAPSWIGSDSIAGGIRNPISDGYPKSGGTVPTKKARTKDVRADTL